MDFDYGIFTNITRDHLDFHKTMANYLEAKSILFSKLGRDFHKGYPKYAIINRDDPHADVMAKSATVPVIYYGLHESAQIRAQSIQATRQGLKFQLVLPEKDYPVNMQLTGLFNVSNALAAVSVCYAMQIPVEKIIAGLEKISLVPGRFQLINRGQDFMVVVDYAHSEDALLNLLKSVREITTGKILVVFGAGGDRDRGKRPMMGEIAAQYADEIIITSDNPRSEDPALISLDIEIGLKRIRPIEQHYQIILDREKAIKTAIQSAKPGDAVVIAGKGHETYQIFRDRTIHFDDSEIAGKYLNEIRGYSDIGTVTN